MLNNLFTHLLTTWTRKLMCNDSSFVSIIMVHKSHSTGSLSFTLDCTQVKHIYNTISKLFVYNIIMEMIKESLTIEIKKKGRGKKKKIVSVSKEGVNISNWCKFMVCLGSGLTYCPPTVHLIIKQALKWSLTISRKILASPLARTC